MTTQEIVNKLWNLCNVLRDDGITYLNYVTELTYLLFLKMLKDTGGEDPLPAGCRWDDLKAINESVLLGKDAQGNDIGYTKILGMLGSQPGRVGEIFRGATSSLRNPANLKKLITSIDGLNWYSAERDGFADMYEGLLEKNASEKKSGAGQYFTPRVLINVVTRLMKPQAGERCNDPAAGTFGFMIAASRYVRDATDNLHDLKAYEAEFQRDEAFTGCEIVADTHRLALMNAMLHRINGEIRLGDTLSPDGKDMKGYDLVLTNPPFGTKKGGESVDRDDFSIRTSNKQLNFLQHIYRSLNKSGRARAAVVLPDNVLFEGGAGEEIRRDLLNKCNLHTVLRLPSGIFYAQGVKTNVFFFTRGTTDFNNTREVWYYDMRTGVAPYGKTKPLKDEHFAEFERCFGDWEHLEDRRETWSVETPEGRWRKFTIDEIMARPQTSLDITWLKEDADADTRTLAELLDDARGHAEALSAAVAKVAALLADVEE